VGGETGGFRRGREVEGAGGGGHGGERARSRWQPAAEAFGSESVTATMPCLVQHFSLL
jgi:hypothetical protein